MEKTTKKIITEGIIVFCFVLFLVVLLILKSNIAISENISSGPARAFIEFMGKISGVFPFSLFELFLYIAIITAVAFICVIIIRLCKKKLKGALSAFLVLVILSLAVADVYTFSAGFAYTRGKVSLPTYESEISESELIEAAEYFAADYGELSKRMERNELGQIISPYTHTELSELLIEEYCRLGGEYFSAYTPKCKTIASKTIMSEMHIVGVFFAPLGEANVNPLTPAVDMPVTMAHELAHAKGVMREDDANLVSYYLMLTSDDEYLRYCGYYACFDRLLSAVGFYSAAEAARIRNIAEYELIAAERLANAQFWAQYGMLAKISNFINDIYLKLQGQKEGTGAYVDTDKIVDEVIVDSSGNETVVSKLELTEVQKMIYQIYTDASENNEKD